MCIRSIKVVHIKNALVECSTAFPVEKDTGISRALLTRVVSLRKSCAWENDQSKKQMQENISVL